MAVKGATVETQSEDAPLLQQLSPEAQRILKVIENCIDKLEISATLPALVQFNSVSDTLDKQLSKALKAYQILHERLEKLESFKQKSDGDQGGEAEGAKKRVRAQLVSDFKNSVRDVLRYFRDHPGAFLGLKAELGLEVEVGRGEYELIQGLKMFHSHMVERLQPGSTSFDQDLEELSALEEEVAASIKQIDEKISQKSKEITGLQRALQENNAQQEKMLPLADPQGQPHIKTSNMKQTRMQQETHQLETELIKLMHENREKERIVQQKNEKLEKEIESVIQDFDDEMEKLQAKLELAKGIYEKGKEELRELEKSFSVLEVKCTQIKEKRRLAEDKRKEEMKELELKTKAAIIAQAWWRGYSTRKALKNKSKGKKAKKGKAKKTK